jgi:malonyl-CoA O-methyltransferase
MALGSASAIGINPKRIEAWVRWLLAMQQLDGSLPPTAHSSVWNTAQFVRGTLTAAPRSAGIDQPALQAAIRAACGYLRSCVESHVASVAEPPEGGPRTCDPITERLVGLAVCQSAGLGDVPISAVEHYANLPGAPVDADAWAWRVEAFLDLGRADLADAALHKVAARHHRDDSLSAIAHFAALWYRTGHREPAERVMRFLERRHLRRHTPLTPDVSPPRGEESAVAIYYLDAAIARVAAAFAVTAADFPDRIDPHDGRAEAVVRWFAAMGDNASVADVGCGKGRFLGLLAERFPAARCTGIDVAPAMLACLPPNVTACRGSLLQIPLPDGCFDGALAVESLEHALLPERAVAEVCRIVRPGGQVLVIDKHRARQPLSHHDPWERWFTPHELADWLGRWCDAVVVEPVAHLEGRPGRNLFLAATGRRK